MTTGVHWNCREMRENNMNINHKVTVLPTAVWKVTLRSELSDVGLIGQGEGGSGCIVYLRELKESACSIDLVCSRQHDR